MVFDERPLPLARHQLLFREIDQVVRNERLGKPGVLFEIAHAVGHFLEREEDGEFCRHGNGFEFLEIFGGWRKIPLIQLWHLAGAANRLISI